MEKQVIEEIYGAMIIAVKGQVRDYRGLVACQLAKHLKYPFIDQDEITSLLQKCQHPDQKSFEIVPDKKSFEIVPDKKSFEIVLKIASDQLTKLKLGVIISTPLGEKNYLDDLKRLANSADAVLVIIQCLPKDVRNDWDIHEVSKFIVDTRRQPFDAEKFVSEELDKIRKRMYRHLHSLIFNNKPNDETALTCKRCNEVISGPYYECILECYDYVFHKDCAEFPGDLDRVRQNCPEYLRMIEPEYLFQKELRRECGICKSKGKDFSDSCHDCLFKASMKGEFLPIIVNHESHAHPLNLIMMPLSFGYEFKCSGCGDFGHSISYRCYDCNFNLHVSCILLPLTVSYHYDKHHLRLTYDSLEQNDLEKSYCEACKMERDPEYWFYYCAACESSTHLDCVTNHSTRLRT